MAGTRSRIALCGLLVALGLGSTQLDSFARQAADLPSDIPDKVTGNESLLDYVLRDEMIPMRDGVKLHTLILVPKGARNAPIVITRTPYGASSVLQSGSTHLAVNSYLGEDTMLDAGYIRVIQDVRGKYGSEGSYVMNRPLRGPLNGSSTDHSSDTWDTIDWLVKHTPESNGRVGIMGTSYGGFTALMGVINPHPALKVAIAVAPMVDVWRGDDWFHNGAFRQAYALDYTYGQTIGKSNGNELWRDDDDEYQFFLAAGSANDAARHTGVDQLPFWQRLRAHPAYDSYWQQQALDQILAREKHTVPTMLVDGQWDQEDIYGAPATFRALQHNDPGNHNNYLVIGPWFHGQSGGSGASLGALTFDGDTSYWFRHKVMQKFLDAHLKDGAENVEQPTVLAYETGTNVWRHYPQWPMSCANGCPASSRSIYLGQNSSLSFSAAATDGYNEYISDPAKPVPYRLRPILPVYSKDSTWRTWLVDDQRNFSDRTDVLVYSSEVLTEPVRIAGQPQVHLLASTSGSDADWVVKLIDVYPAQVPKKPAMSSYQLMISADILRGRYRAGWDHAVAIEPGKVLEYQFALPDANHVFLPGHRIMVQVQSSWFPLYDRNPQSFVENIFFAKPSDYVKANQRVYFGSSTPSRIDLPVLPISKSDAATVYPR